MEEFHKEQIWEQVLKSTKRVDPNNIVGFLQESHKQIFDEERASDSVILKVSGNIRPKKSGNIHICRDFDDTLSEADKYLSCNQNKSALVILKDMTLERNLFSKRMHMFCLKDNLGVQVLEKFQGLVYSKVFWENPTFEEYQRYKMLFFKDAK